MKSRLVLLSTTLGLLAAVAVAALLSLPATTTYAQIDTWKNASTVGSDGAPELEATQAVSTAYVLVRFGDNDSIVRPVTFTEPISALVALELSGLTFTTSDTGYGPFLCSIEDVGDSSPACSNGTQYWGTSAWNDAEEKWDMRLVGIAGAMITETGHVEGFSWSAPGWTSIDPPPAPSLTAAWRALSWLETQQQSDGGYGSAGNTAEVLMALGANRMDATSWRVGDGPSVLSATLKQGRELASTAAGASKLALALTLHVTCWPFATPRPMDFYSATTGAYDTNAGNHALAMLGTASLSETIPPSATTYLLEMQQSNGGWEWGAGWGTDTNSTALALQALIAAGELSESTAVISGLTFLKQSQNSDGGFTYSKDSPWGTDSDTNSTAYVVQALLAVGQDPMTTTWTMAGFTPIDFLLSMQVSDGSLEYQTDAAFGKQSATQQATTAMLFRSFPIREAALPPCPCETVFLPFISRD